MGYFQVRYDPRVLNHDRRGFIGLATGCGTANYILAKLEKRVKSQNENFYTCGLVLISESLSPLNKPLSQTDADNCEEIGHQGDGGFQAASKDRSKH